MKRKLSWLLAVVAVVAPVAWSYLMLTADTQAQKQAHGFVCGLPSMAILVLGSLMMAALSTLASGIGVWAYLDLKRPRPTRRTFELFALSVPLFVAIVIFLQLVFGGPRWLP